MAVHSQFDERYALAVAHPGHEIRMFGWLEANRPTTYILTDGSGRNGISRLNSSAKLLTDLDVPLGPIFGEFTDRQIYSQVLAKNAEPFLRMAETMANDFVRQKIDVVLGDACEGLIMAHDVWRAVIDRAVLLASVRRGVQIRNLAFSLDADPRQVPDDPTCAYVQDELDDSIWKRKIQAAESFKELQAEVRQAFSQWGKFAFRYETIWDQPRRANSIDWADKPSYELHGEAQVEAGVYPEVVRYREHVQPILAALQSDQPLGARAA